MILEVSQDTGLLGLIIVLVIMNMRKVSSLCKDVTNLKAKIENIEIFKT